MPELPEVETIARGLHKRVSGDCIEEVWLSGKAPTFKSKPAEIATTLRGTCIATVRRMGKHIVFDLIPASEKRTRSRLSKKTSKIHASAPSPQWIVHLGMT